MNNNKITDTLIIKIDPHSEGGFNVDVYDSEESMEEMEPLDGGIYEGSDMKGAIAMAMSLVKDLTNWDHRV